MSDPIKTKSRIIKKLENLPPAKLDRVFHFIESIEDHSKNKTEILSFAGSWKGIDQGLFDEFIADLPRRRAANGDSRRIF